MDDGRVKKIMLVEDNRDHAELMTISIKKTFDSVQLIRAKDGEEALIKMGISNGTNGNAVFYPDLVLLDINLPGINGKEVLMKMRATKQFENTPVCVLTTSTRNEEVELMLNLGADAYIPKMELESQIDLKIKEFLK